MSTFKVYANGDTLPNGAVVIGATAKVIEDEGVVVAKYGDEYVTWNYCPSHGDTFWGHYFQEQSGAMKDYYSRSASLNRR